MTAAAELRIGLQDWVNPSRPDNLYDGNVLLLVGVDTMRLLELLM